MKNKLNFIKQISKFLLSTANIIVFLIVVSIIVLLYFNQNLDSNFNNFTWIFSASMQTLAAIIALLPISYSFYLRKIEDEKGKDYDSYILVKLEKNGYYEMMFVIIFSVITIICNLYLLFNTYDKISSIIITFLTLLSIQFVVIYIFRLFDPDRVKNILMELDTKGNNIKVKGNINLDEFISAYLNLENVVKDYISNENDTELIDNMPLYDIVDNLSKDFPIIEEFFDDFKSIIYHRNNLIHNYNQVEVDYSKYLKIKELIKEFAKLNDQFISDKIFGNVLSVKTLIDAAIDEYITDYRNRDLLLDSSKIQDFEESLSALLQTYFISEYYDTIDFDETIETDFEVIQNNYSNRKLVGVLFKVTDIKNFKNQAKVIFNKLKSKFLYLFIINLNVVDNKIEMYYMTKSKTIKYEERTISYD